MTLGYTVDAASTISGEPIRLVLTGFERPSENEKTGPMVQAWIIPRDVLPGRAVRTGRDRAVCGDCPRRPLLARGSGLTPCYVRVDKAPQQVAKTARQGRYERLNPATDGHLLAGRQLRLGAWAEPTALPFDDVEPLTAWCAGWTGYTHQWRSCDQRWSQLLMASVDTPEERDEARELGWRTFRVGSGILPGEFSCPASEEQGHRLTCDRCLACAGKRSGRSDVVIQPHGHGKRPRASQKGFEV
jgi:hypothetical protein